MIVLVFITAIRVRFSVSLGAPDAPLMRSSQALSPDLTNAGEEGKREAHSGKTERKEGKKKNSNARAEAMGVQCAQTRSSKLARPTWPSFVWRRCSRSTSRSRRCCRATSSRLASVSPASTSQSLKSRLCASDQTTLCRERLRYLPPSAPTESSPARSHPPSNLHDDLLGVPAVPAQGSAHQSRPGQHELGDGRVPRLRPRAHLRVGHPRHHCARHRRHGALCLAPCRRFWLGGEDLRRRGSREGSS